MSDLEDLPLIEPRMGRSHRASSRARGASFRNALLSVMRRGAWSNARKAGRARSRVAVPRPGQSARRVVVKAHVVRMTPSGAKAAALHLRYIERDGVERDGSKGHLYTAEGPARVEAFDEPRNGERHQFRLIVSPEDAGELDLTDYVRRLMATVERDLGRKLEWAAVNHYDTGHPHAHLVVRGVDREGREVRLDRGYISQGLRWRAQELATEELGPRLAVDVQRAQAREVTQDRFTSLDRELERRANDGEVAVHAGSGPGLDFSTLVARLEHLEGLQLAERISPASWRLADGWQQELRDLGARGDVLKQIHAAICRDPAHYRIVRDGEPVAIDADAPRVASGRVASKGLSDELKGAFYIVVDTPSGRAYHLALDARTAETVSPGDIVSFATRPESPVRPVDREIAERATTRGGVYTLQRTAGGATPAQERRLRELERLGLATPVAPDHWRISPNLLEALAERHRDLPVRHRLSLRKEPLPLQAQVGHPGPVWLDRVHTENLAPHSFGADVKRVVEQRAEALRRLGVQPHDPNRSAKLRELERRALGGEIAARSAKIFLPSAPDGFRGRVRTGHAGSSAGSYAVVSDGQSFILLHATAALRAAHGTTVTVARDAKGRLLVRPAPDRDIGS